MSSLDNFKFFFKTIKILGLAQSSSTANGISFITYLNSILWTLILSFLFYYISTNNIFHAGSNTGRLLDQAQIAIPLLNHVFIIAETIRKHKDDFQIWSTMQSINLSSSNFLTRQTNNGLISYFALVSFGVLGCGFISELFIIGASYKVNVPWTKSWLARFPSNQMIRLNTVHYLFYVVFIMDRMKKISAELQDVAEQSVRVRGARSEKVIQRRVWQARKTHQLIRLLKFHIDKRFGLMMLVTIGNFFIVSTVCWYYLASRIYYNYLFGMFESALCTVPLFTSLIGLAWCCEDCSNASSSVGSSLHEIATENPKTNAMIRVFSAQLQGIEMTAGKFFFINFSMMKSMVFSITTYIVVFISMNQEEGRY